MNPTAERLLSEIKALPPADIEQLCDCVVQWAAGRRAAGPALRDAVDEAIRASPGLFAGSRLTEKLLEERRRERDCEAAEAEGLRPRRHG